MKYPCICIVRSAITLTLIGATSASRAEEVLPRSEEVLPLGALVLQQIDLDEASPAELLAGAESQFSFFFPGGVSTSVGDRTQVDALVTTVILLEEGLRRGAGTARHARTLFDCYVLMYASGRAGVFANALSELLAMTEQREEREILSTYEQTLDQFETHGRESAFRIGELLLRVDRDDTEVAYTLATIAEQAGQHERAEELYSRGLHNEQYARHLLSLAEIQATNDTSTSDTTVERAIELDPNLESEVDALRERAALRSEIAELAPKLERGRASAEERYRLAVLYRRVGDVRKALDLLEELEDWSDAPPELVEEYAIAAMEANLPGAMRDILATTRDRDDPSGRLLQLRIVGESLGLVTAAAEGDVTLASYLDTDAGQPLASDLQTFSQMDPTRAQFVRVYLELVTALVEYRQTGALDTARTAAISSEIDALLEAEPDRVAGYRFKLMLAIYGGDTSALNDAIDAYGRHCRTHECGDEHRRIAATVLLQTVARSGELALLANVDNLVEDWPSEETGPFYHLVTGTSSLLQSRLGRAADEDEHADEARRAFSNGLLGQWDLGGRNLVASSDIFALYGNLAYLALNDRDIAAAKLYLDAGRQFDANHPVLLMNLGVALATGRNLIDAFVVFGVAANASVVDAGLSFQVLRWAGHLYTLADRGAESREALSQALTIYEMGGDWTVLADDGVFPGGPVEWGLLYEEDEGLTVTLDLASVPIFFVPAPVSVLELSAAAE